MVVVEVVVVVVFFLVGVEIFGTSIPSSSCSSPSSSGDRKTERISSRSVEWISGCAASSFMQSR